MDGESKFALNTFTTVTFFLKKNPSQLPTGAINRQSCVKIIFLFYIKVRKINLTVTVNRNNIDFTLGHFSRID